MTFDMAKKVVKHYLQGLTPRDRTADDRYDPPKYANELKKQYEEDSRFRWRAASRRDSAHAGLRRRATRSATGARSA
jgi:hypothetical protein